MRETGTRPHADIPPSRRRTVSDPRGGLEPVDLGDERLERAEEDEHDALAQRLAVALQLGR